MMRKLIKYFSILLVVLLSLSTVPLLQAAQLIDRIPVELQDNWTVCVNYEARQANCKNQTSPVVEIPSAEIVREFIYKKDFIVSSDLQQSTLSIWLDEIDDVDEVRINNRLIGGIGHFPPQFQSGFRYKRLYLIPSIYIKFNQFNQLEIKTFSSINRPGISSNPIIIGDYFEMIKQQQQVKNSYISVIAVLLLLVLFLVSYFLMTRNGYETIFLALALIFFAIVTFIRSDTPVIIGLNLSAVFKVEAFFLCSAFIALSLFAIRFFDLHANRRYITGCVIIGIPGVISILYPNPLHARYISEISSLITCTISILIFADVITNSLKKKKKYVVHIAVFLASICIAYCLDSLSQSRAIFNLPIQISSLALPITIAISAIGISLTLNHKFWQVFKGVTFDHLTQTLLRPAFFQRLTEEMHRSQIDRSNLLLVVINLQEVKDIESSYGQIARNKMLVSVSQKLVELLDPADLICHFNDDEFCITTHVESEQLAENKLKNIHRELVSNQQIIGKDTEFYVSAKIAGIIYNPDRHLSISQLLQDVNYGLAKVKTKNNSDFLLLNHPVNNS